MLLTKYCEPEICLKAERTRWFKTCEFFLGELGVATCHHITNRTTNEGATVEDEGQGHQARLVVVPPEGPPRQARHDQRSVPHEIGSNHLLAHSFLTTDAQFVGIRSVIRVVLARQNLSLVAPVQLAVVQVQHRGHAHQSRNLPWFQAALANGLLLLDHGDIGGNHQICSHGEGGKEGTSR